MDVIVALERTTLTTCSPALHRRSAIDLTAAFATLPLSRLHHPSPHAAANDHRDNNGNANANASCSVDDGAQYAAFKVAGPIKSDRSAPGSCAMMAPRASENRKRASDSSWIQSASQRRRPFHDANAANLRRKSATSLTAVAAEVCRSFESRRPGAAPQPQPHDSPVSDDDTTESKLGASAETAHLGQRAMTFAAPAGSSAYVQSPSTWVTMHANTGSAPETADRRASWHAGTFAFDPCRLARWAHPPTSATSRARHRATNGHTDVPDFEARAARSSTQAAEHICLFPDLFAIDGLPPTEGSSLARYNLTGRGFDLARDDDENDDDDDDDGCQAGGDFNAMPGMSAHGKDGGLAKGPTSLAARATLSAVQRLPDDMADLVGSTMPAYNEALANALACDEFGILAPNATDLDGSATAYRYLARCITQRARRNCRALATLVGTGPFAAPARGMADAAADPRSGADAQDARAGGGRHERHATPACGIGYAIAHNNKGASANSTCSVSGNADSDNSDNPTASQGPHIGRATADAKQRVAKACDDIIRRSMSPWLSAGAIDLLGDLVAHELGAL